MPSVEKYVTWEVGTLLLNKTRNRILSQRIRY